jgi:hypothetical protein
MANQCVTLKSPTNAAPPQGFPVIITEWDRNSREVVRVALDRFNGKHTINIRVWYRDGDELRPSKSGVTLAVKHLEPMAIGLANALTVACEMGLVEEGGEQ